MGVWWVRDAVLGVTQREGKMHTMMKVIVVSGEHGIDASQYRWPSRLQIRKKTRMAAV